MRTLLITLLAAAAISSPARKLLNRADAFEKKGDSIAAMSAYVRAVKLDPKAEDLSRVKRFYFGSADMTDEQRATLTKLIGEALRLYVARHPLEWEAVGDFTNYAGFDDGMKALETYRAAHPAEPRVYQRRGDFRFHRKLHYEAFFDYQKAIELEQENAYHHFHYGVAAFQAMRIEAGLAALDRALVLKPDYREALVYRGLLLREQASRETDPEKKKLLTAAAEAALAQVRAMLKK